MNEMILNLAHYTRKYNIENLLESSSYETNRYNICTQDDYIYEMDI